VNEASGFVDGGSHGAMPPGGRRIATHTLDDLCIFHEASQVVRLAGQMSQAELDFERMVNLRKFSDAFATCAVEAHEMNAFGRDIRHLEVA